MQRAFVFPGQGSQTVGMGKAIATAFPAARHVFEEVDEALKQKLSQLLFEGPEADLTLTENAQPAIMATSLAVLRALEKETGRTLPGLCRYVMGHSLGEYTALAAAGTFSVADAARLLRIRGRAMQAAVPVGDGAMAALLGMELDAVQAVAAEAAHGEICVAANDNAPGQIVISGHATAVDRAIDLAKDRGVRRAVKLAVSAPFHCPLMAPAAERMREALSEVDMRMPSVPLVANVTADIASEPAIIRDLLVRQVTDPVRWRESVLTLRDHGITQLVELGAGNVLSGLTRRIDAALQGVSIHTPQELEAFLGEL